jgi:sugar phosphate permease
MECLIERRKTSLRKRCQRLSHHSRSGGACRSSPCCCSFASGIVNYLDRSALSIANIEVRQEPGLSATAMGVLLSAFLMSYAFSQLPAGILVDRIGLHILLGVGLALAPAIPRSSGRWQS